MWPCPFLHREHIRDFRQDKRSIRTLLSASTAATYVFITLTCTTTIISLEPCALDAEFQHLVLSCSISYWDLIKCPYFDDTTERAYRGWKQAQRQGEDRVTLQITLLGVGFGHKRLACTMGIDVPRKSNRTPIKVLGSRKEVWSLKF
jgi:hypothetical protein